MTGPEIAAKLRAARPAQRAPSTEWVLYLALAITLIAQVAAWFAPKLGTISGGW